MILTSYNISNFLVSMQHVHFQPVLIIVVLLNTVCIVYIKCCRSQNKKLPKVLYGVSRRADIQSSILSTRVRAIVVKGKN